MNLTEDEKLRIKILKIKLRKGVHRTVKTGIRIAKKIGFFAGLTLVSLCCKGQSPSSCKNILVSAITEKKDDIELLRMLENKSQNDSLTNAVIKEEINTQINLLAKEFLCTRTDSLHASIDRLKNPSLRNKEIRRNFKDAVGVPQISSHCLATQCAADYRALKAMGLEKIIPQSLKESSALCRSYIRTDEVKPFIYEVANTDTAIREFIRTNNLSGGTLIFYPRDRYNYHAVSVDMPEGDFEYDDSTYQILTSSANKERKSVPISTSSFRAKAPGRKAIIVNKLEFFVALLENHLKGKTLAEQTALLYQGGANEFLQNVSKATAIDEKQMVAEIKNMVAKSYLDMPKDKKIKDGLYVLALVPLVHNRNSNQNMYMLDVIENELNEFSSLDDKCAYLDKELGKAFVGMPKDEQKQFMDSLIYSSENNFIEADQTRAVFAAYRFWQIFNQASAKSKEDEWHKVASIDTKSIVKKTPRTVKTTVRTVKERS